MLIRTHLAITLFFVLLFISHIEQKLAFALIAFGATFIPDMDSRFSILGRKKIMRFLQFFTKHRGMIHSFTFLLTITFFLVLLFPVVALPFFLGYSLHLLADSFTLEGIRPFYPSKKKIKGWVRTGGKTEMIVLVSFILGDVFLLGMKIFRMF